MTQAIAFGHQNNAKLCLAAGCRQAFSKRGFERGRNDAKATAPRLIRRDVGEVDDPWDYGRVLPIRSPYATTVWDYINRGMPLGMEGTLTPDEVYSIVAYLLFLNDVIEEDMVLDQDNLPKIEMPNRNNFARVPDWFPRKPRLEGYPY